MISSACHLSYFCTHAKKLSNGSKKIAPSTANRATSDAATNLPIVVFLPTIMLYVTERTGLQPRISFPDRCPCEAQETRIGPNRRATFYANTLRKHFLHCSGGALLHVGQHVRVGVEGNGYGCVPEHLRHYLGIDVLGEQQRGARMPEVVKPYLG
jgi:hypothetical protein